MPYYIATVWTVSHDNGKATHARRVERRFAQNEQEFRRKVEQDCGDVDVAIGPVSLSRQQGLLP